MAVSPPLLDVGGIRSTVAVHQVILLAAGVNLAALFSVSLYGVASQLAWGLNLTALLETSDIDCEFIEQGTLALTVSVSIVVAAALLRPSYLERRGTNRPKPM